MVSACQTVDFAIIAYPDSVRRVRPPNTTMPKTLAALPSSQYATTLEFVCGHLDDFVLLIPCAVSFSTLLLTVDEKALMDCDSLFSFIPQRNRCRLDCGGDVEACLRNADRASPNSCC